MNSFRNPSMPKTYKKKKAPRQFADPKPWDFWMSFSLVTWIQARMTIKKHHPNSLGKCYQRHKKKARVHIRRSHCRPINKHLLAWSNLRLRVPSTTHTVSLIQTTSSKSTSPKMLLSNRWTSQISKRLLNRTTNGWSTRSSMTTLTSHRKAMKLTKQSLKPPITRNEGSKSSSLHSTGTR